MSKAKKIITNPCLIAADIDNTILQQGSSSEKDDFLTYLAPELIKVADGGTNIAVITGNSFEELSTRFFDYLLTYLEKNSKIKLLSKFHFFCNSGGVHFWVPPRFLEEGEKDVLRDIIFYNSSFLINPDFINNEYLKKTEIEYSAISEITKILCDEWDSYVRDFKKNIKRYKREYYIDDDPGDKNVSIRYPISGDFDSVDPVNMRYLDYTDNFKSTVQMTLKPILTWKHAKNPEAKLNNDKRSEIIARIHKKLDFCGLTGYTARPGGSSSIDITRSKLDKSYAVSYLIDYLGIEGNERKGEKYGSNVIYLGDEVISGGGNDYPVTKIDGVLVLALNKVPKFVPFKSRVIVPSSLQGPKAAEEVLSRYNDIVRRELPKWSERMERGLYPEKNAIQIFKDTWFTENIKEKINKTTLLRFNLSTEELQVLYTFVTLIYRNDESAKKWTNVLVNELDMIMEVLDENDAQRLEGIGASYQED